MVEQVDGRGLALYLAQLVLHAVELLDVALLELGRPLAGEAHDKESKSIFGHYHLATRLALSVSVVSHHKIVLAKCRIAIKVVNGPQYRIVAFAKPLCDFQTVSSHVAFLGFENVGYIY